MWGESDPVRVWCSQRETVSAWDDMHGVRCWSSCMMFNDVPACCLCVLRRKVYRLLELEQSSWAPWSMADAMEQPAEGIPEDSQPENNNNPTMTEQDLHSDRQAPDPMQGSQHYYSGMNHGSMHGYQGMQAPEPGGSALMRHLAASGASAEREGKSMGPLRVSVVSSLCLSTLCTTKSWNAAIALLIEEFMLFCGTLI